MTENGRAVFHFLLKPIIPGVVLASFGSGLGEVSYLSLSAYFPESVLKIIYSFVSGDAQHECESQTKLMKLPLYRLRFTELKICFLLSVINRIIPLFFQ